MEILFVSDYVCPYCLVAKEALRCALERTGLNADITWQPFELTQEPQPRVDTYHDPRRKAGYQVLAEPCRKLKLPMKLPPEVVPRPYTRLAFEGWHYACAQGKGNTYNDLVYKAYFLDELDIGDIDILTDLAETAGLSPSDFRNALENGTYQEQQQSAVDYARNTLKVTHVPTIFIDGQEVSLRSYTPEEMLSILLDSAARSSCTGFGCGPDGC